MPLTKSNKKEIVKNLEQAIANSSSLVFVNFHGLKVADETQLRRDLEAEGVSYKVSRKTLLTRALSGKAKGEVPTLDGEVAIAYSSVSGTESKDETVAPREIYNFQKTHKGFLNILGGIFEGKFMDSAGMTELSMIPSREVLYAQFVNLINSPLQRLAVVMGEVAKSK
jgi:large subunit ribosomal protein L10